MSTTLITGATGFLGSHLAQALAERDDELRVLARRGADTTVLDGIDYDRVVGDVTDRRAVRRAVDGVQRVFHLAGSTSMLRADASRVFDVNVHGTAIVCEEARRAGVERLVHTSSVATIGPAREGGRADESQAFGERTLDVPYVSAKREAEARAFAEGAKGLDLVVVNPTFVLGARGGPHSWMALLRRFLERRVPAYVDGGINVVDVRDVAAGQVLAAEKGGQGERYILGGRNFTLQRLFADLSRISGVPVPPAKLPARAAVGGAWIGERLGFPMPISLDETRSASLWWTYSSLKAKRELGFEPRAHEDTLRDAIEWQAERLGGPWVATEGAADAAIGIAGRALRAAGRISPR